MLKRLSPLAAASALLSLVCLGDAPAQAFQLVTFVSGKGTDSGTCASPASPCHVEAVNSIAAGNGTGFFAQKLGSFSLAHSTATGNLTGVLIFSSGGGISYGDNHILINLSNVVGTLSNVGTQ